MNNSVFSKIIRGEIPSYKVYEDEHVFAFLDINPINPGHTLVVPKVEIDHLWDLDDATYNNLLTVAKKLARHIKKTLNAPRVGMVVEGFAIPHAHIHLLPVYEGFEATMRKPKTDQNSPDDLTSMAKKLWLKND